MQDVLRYLSVKRCGDGRENIEPKNLENFFSEETKKVTASDL